MSTPVDDLAQFASVLPPTGPVLAFDVGTKTIGLSVSDNARIVASPLTGMKRGRFFRNAEEIAEICNSRGVCGLIVGLPKHMNGSEGARCQASRAFAGNLCRHLHLPTSFWDERLSTVEAERYLIDGGMSRQRRRQLVDQVAAALFLQSALDYMHNCICEMDGHS